VEKKDAQIYAQRSGDVDGKEEIIWRTKLNIEKRTLTIKSDELLPQIAFHSSIN